MSPHRGKRRAARKPGRHVNDRLRAMRFALWAQHIPKDLLTTRQIVGLLDLSPQAARMWRRDFLNAISPADYDGVPYFLTPSPAPQPARETPSPAATGTTATKGTEP